MGTESIVNIAKGRRRDSTVGDHDGMSIYSATSEVDDDLASLTVVETATFSARNKTVSSIGGSYASLGGTFSDEEDDETGTLSYDVKTELITPLTGCGPL